MSSTRFHLLLNLSCWLLVLTEDKYIQNLIEDKKRAAKTLSSDRNFHTKNNYLHVSTKNIFLLLLTRLSSLSSEL